MEKYNHLISEIRLTVQRAIKMAWEVNDTAAHLQTLSFASEQIRGAFLALGDHCHDFLEELPSESEVDLLALYVCNYDWAGNAKSFLILWRNILWEEKKAHILTQEGLLEATTMLQLRQASLAKVTEMAEVVTEGLEAEVKRLREGNKNGLLAIKKWRLQQNPWPVYRQQIETIPEQCINLANNHERLTAGLEILKGLHQSIEETVTAARKEMDLTHSLAQQTLQAITEETEKGEAARPGSLAARLEHIQEQMLLPNHLNSFLADFEATIAPLPEKLTLTIDARGGMLHTLDCNLQRRAESWLEASAFPLLYELWEITESARSGTKMALVNVRNRALLLAAEDKDQKTVDLRDEALAEPLLLYQSTIANSESEFAALERLLLRRLNRDFKLGLIYQEGKPGLVFGQAPSSFDQFGRNRFLRDISSWTNKQVKLVKSFIRRVEQEEALSASEKIVRYIEARNGNGADSHYASIFLTRGYIGESFCVGREKEMAHFSNLVDQWQLGYRGSVCLTGNRFSGKSLFGELVTHRFFPSSAIRISPGETVRVEGRKVALDYDLEKALNEIRKITLNRRPLIWIDDLELWWSHAHPLNKNVRALRRFLDSQSTDMFFLVAMSNTVRAYLHRFHHLDRLFQAEINMDRMSGADIRQAIWVRHRATNRILIDKEGKELPPQQLTRISNRIHRASRGNVGEALNMWSMSTNPVGEDTVTNTFADSYALPDFITSDSGLLLSHIMVQKRTNEYHLRKLFGPAFADKYANILKRLLSVGLIQRQLDGALEVNKLVVNELGEMLDYHGYLKYRKWKN